jgi:pilus assembly protein Flp/PilA
MEYFLLMLRGLNVDKRAVTAIEYALIASLIAVVIVTAVTTLGTTLNSAFANITNKI